MADIFLSYNREDRPRALQVADALGQEGLSVWWDSDLRAGENYDEVTENNLRNAGVVVVLWSKRSVQSKWVRAEATIGQRKSSLMPAMIEDCDRPLLFELIQTADLTKWQGDRDDPEWRQFITHIRGRLKAAAPIAPAAQPPAAAPAQAAPRAPQQPQRADPEKTRQIEAATALHAATVETTFWQSIKDGTNPADYEAYLARYPDGHFTEIARNRIAMYKASKAAPKAPPAAEAPRHQPAPKPPASDAPRPQMKQPAPQTRPAPPPPPPRPAAAPVSIVERRKGGGMMLPLVIVAGLLLIGGGGAYFLLLAPKTPASVKTASAAEPKEAAPPTSLRGSQTDTAPTDSSTVAEKQPEKLVVPADASASSEPASAPVKASAAPATPVPTAAPETSSTPVKSAGSFQDCPICPQMTPVRGGTFLMGSPKDQPGHYGYEGPQHQVTVAPFIIGTTEVTFDEWAACAADGGCSGNPLPRDQGFGRGKRPVIGISWEDAESYVAWLSHKTGKRYRLPSEAEWEMAARGGADTPYPWGAEFGSGHVPSGQTQPAGSFAANGYGIYDMIGNAAEWVEDCYASNYNGAPTDGRAWLDSDCGRRVIRGGYYRSSPNDLRTTNRGRIERANRASYTGLRVARSQ